MSSFRMKDYHSDYISLYFDNIRLSDSLLLKNRIRNRIYAPSNRTLIMRTYGYLPEYIWDSTGTTYYTPMTDPQERTYFMYFRMPSEFIKRPVNPAMLTGTNGKPSLISFHGNVYYEFLYRSRTDTPFVDNNFQQHTEQIYTDAVIKNRYPLRIILNSRQSNSPYFKNYTDINIQFNQPEYLHRVKKEMISGYAERIKSNSGIGRYEDALVKKLDTYSDLKNWLENPGRVQEIIEEKEPLYRQVSTLKEQQYAIEKDVKSNRQRIISDSLKSAALSLLIAQLEARLGSRQKEMTALKDSGQTGKRIYTQDSAIKTRRDSAIRDVQILSDSLEALRSKLGKINAGIAALRENGGVSPALLKKLSIAGRKDSLRHIGTVAGDSIITLLEAQKDSLIAKAKMPGQVEEEMERKKKELDSLSKSISLARHAVDSIKQGLQSNIDSYSSRVFNARSVSELKTVAGKDDLYKLSTVDRNLLAITKFNIGRSSINYSDLTVNNISINGVNVEYNPSFYAAFALGSVDYLFRDFVIKPDRFSKQNLLLGRIGWGSKDNRIIILSAYKGAKNSLISQATGTGQATPSVKVTEVFGYSMEIKYSLNKYANISLEGAKSSVPYRMPGDREKAINNAFVYSDRNNEAWAARLHFYYPKTQSLVNAFYRQSGVNFQSYSIFNSGTRQEFWGIKWQQYLWKKNLSLTGQLRKNGFDNPLVQRSYSSSVVFKSIQAMLRIKKWPVLSVSYMPNTQLTKTAEGNYSENVYYALTGNMFYNYRAGRNFMNSSLFYSRFYNKGSDSGFIHYNAKNISFSHAIIFKGLQTQTEAQYTTQPALTYFTFSQKADKQLSGHFNASVGIRGNVIPGGALYVGAIAGMDCVIRKLGKFQMQYDKGHLPGYNNKLTPNNWGRVTYTKIF